MGQRIIRKRTAKEALPRSRKRVPLTDEKREKVLSLAVDGYSIRQIAQACRASKTTVGRWLALLHDDIEKAERKRSKEQAEQKRRESAREQQASLPGEAPREAPRRKLDGNPEHSSQIDESFFPDLPFGGILESRGRPDPPVSFPVDIKSGPQGALCSRCRQYVGGDVHDLLFDVDENDIGRPVCRSCRTPEDRLRPWPALPGSVSFVPRRR